MEFVPFEPGIEVNGRTVWSVVDGFRSFKLLASQYLLSEGIGSLGTDGHLTLDPDGWYQQEQWLRAFRKAATLGSSLLFDIGLVIPRNAEFPPAVKDIHDAIRSVDVAYHLNHRKQGQVMFDPATGTMLEGIGHYGYEAQGPRRIVSVCENPYPCAFDRGVLTAMAQRFEPRAVVTHDRAAPCRMREADSCRYEIAW